MELEESKINQSCDVVNHVNEKMSCSQDKFTPPAELVKTTAKDAPRLGGTDISTVKTADSYVLFADLLATKSMMEEIEHDRDAKRIYKTFVDIADCFRSQVQTLAKEIKGITDQEKTCLQSAIISDSYVVSVPATPECLRALIKAIAIFQKICILDYKKLLRGGVSFGRMAIGNPEESNKLIIGQAFVKAHLLELKVASYPRIIFADDVEIDELQEKRFIGSDKDRMRYISFLDGAKDDELIQIRCNVEKGRESAKTNPHDRQKWDWMLTYIDQVRGQCTNCCSNNQKTYA